MHSQTVGPLCVGAVACKKIHFHVHSCVLSRGVNNAIVNEKVCSKKKKKTQHLGAYNIICIIIS